MSDSEYSTITQNHIKFDEPSKWAIVVYDDDVTPIDFVVALLEQIFGYAADVAYGMTDTIQDTGSLTAGVFQHEIADQKYEDAMHMVASHEYTLKLELKEIAND
jgi:ATP-dependent Clp protease adaptor protein ClpS